MPSLTRSAPKPLKVPSLARSVHKPLKVPSLARSVLKPLKEPSLARSVPKPLSIFALRHVLCPSHSQSSLSTSYPAGRRQRGTSTDSPKSIVSEKVKSESESESESEK